MVARGGCALLAALLAGLAWPGAAVGCLRADVALTVSEGFPFVPATIGGTPVTMLLDTGSDGMLVTPEAAALLRLPPDGTRTTRLFGTGGDRDAPNVVLAGVRVGGARLAPISAPVLALPLLPPADPPFAGLLGAPMLAEYDLDLDVPRGRMTLLGPGCPAPNLPGAAEVALVIRDREVLVPIQVNGVRLLALFDTGSRATIVTEAAAARAGLDRAPPSANTARGVDGTPLRIQHVRARTVQVAGPAMTDVPVSVAPLRLGRADMVLGLDIVGRQRVFVSFRTGRLVLATAP